MIVKKQCNIGIIGCGGLGSQHAEMFHRIRGARLFGFCNRTIEKAERLCKEFGGEFYTRDAQELISHPHIDVVVIATHHDSHASLCVEAVKHGKHIVVEKPLALTVKECVDVVNSVRLSSAKCMVAFKFRYSPTIQRARALLPHPQLLLGRMVDDRWADDYWAQDPLKGGGNVRSQGCHMIDLLCYLAQSRPIRVYAEASNLTHPDHPCVDQMAATIRFENGSVASWIQGDSGTTPRASKWSLALYSQGNKTAEIYDRLKSATFRIGTRVEEMHRHGEEGLYFQNSEFLDCLRRNQDPPCQAIDGLLATLLIERCLQSSQSGKAEAISWDGDLPVLKPGEGTYQWLE